MMYMRRGFTLIALVSIACQGIPLAGDVEKTEFRKPANDSDLAYWLDSMLRHHRYTTADVMLATGLTEEEVHAAAKRLKLDPLPPEPSNSERIRVLPYPGGRHPRLGFLDGAIRPQRETKVSIFTPWRNGGYVVVDVPEAIWCQDGLLYLAHTHVPTIWAKQNIDLEPLEWTRKDDGTLEVERTLPNRVTFGARVAPQTDHVDLSMWLRNGSDRPLTDLRVQMCAMLGYAAGFETQSNDNKVFHSPFAASKSSAGDRWVIMAWEPTHRVWGNPPCPCLHSDPKFWDCAPGQTQHLRGWFSFYEGADIDAELRRIEQVWKR